VSQMRLVSFRGLSAICLSCALIARHDPKSTITKMCRPAGSSKDRAVPPGKGRLGVCEGGAG
jgi:hypothetical protein